MIDITKRPLQPEQLRQFVDEQRQIRSDLPGEMPQKTKGLILGKIRSAVGSEEDRYKVLAFLFGQPGETRLSSKALDDRDWYILANIVYTYNHGQYTFWETLPTELKAMVTAENEAEYLLQAALKLGGRIVAENPVPRAPGQPPRVVVPGRAPRALQPKPARRYKETDNPF